jgi:DNA replication protein DnaC
MSGTPSQIEYYARALRAPRISDGFCRLGDQARDAGWSHEEYLAAVLSLEVSEREASGAATRMKAARFPAHKDLEEFNFDHQPSADRNLIAHPGTGVFLSEAKNVVLLGPPGTGKTHLAVGIGIRRPRPGSGFFSTQRPAGSPDCRRPIPVGNSPRNWSNYAATGSS